MRLKDTGFREFGFRDLSSLTSATALTISSLVNDSRPNNIFGAFSALRHKHEFLSCTLRAFDVDSCTRYSREVAYFTILHG